MSSYKKLFVAAERNVDRLEEILDAGRIPLTATNYLGQNLAHIAAKSGNLDVLKYVLEKNPSLLNAKDFHKCTVLHRAVVKGSLDVVKYLVEEHNADICQLSGNHQDRTALHVAVEFNHLDILKYFVEQRHVNFDVPNPDQTIPPLFMAVRNRNWDVIEYLVEEKKANVQLLKKNQENILFVIVRENSMSLLKYLLDERKIDFNVDWSNIYGETPLHVAAELGRIEMLEYLVDEKNATVDMQKMKDDQTPLHYAASRDEFDACEFLIDRGADPSAEDNRGDIPADKAHDEKLIDYLRSAAKSRSRRSINSLHSLPKETPSSAINLFESIGPLSPPVSLVEGNRSPAQGSLNFHNFFGIIYLAKLLMKKTEGERRTENLISFPSPPSIVRSRMDSMAIGVIDAKTGVHKKYNSLKHCDEIRNYVQTRTNKLASFLVFAISFLSVGSLEVGERGVDKLSAESS